jgi:hypothetical protein
LLLLTGCGSTPLQSGHAVRQQAAHTGETLVGTPYRWGGTSPAEGFDCSGLIWYAYRQAGVQLPRTVDAQYAQLAPIAAAELGRGDLLFFQIPQADNLHVGLYLGEQRFVHAPSSGKKVSYASLRNPFWQRCLVERRRVSVSDSQAATAAVAPGSKDDLASPRLTAKVGRHTRGDDDAGGLVDGGFPRPLVKLFNGLPDAVGKLTAGLFQ